MLTQPLHDEHQELLPYIENIRIVADSVGEVSIEVLRQGVGDVYDFLTHHLIPHAQAEDEALYPVVGKLMGAPDATATMRRDHVAVGQLTDELASLRSELSKAAVPAKALRRVLYGLYTLVKVHFAKEEEVYLPILEAKLTAETAHQMFEAMEEAAKKAKGHLAAH